MIDLSKELDEFFEDYEDSKRSKFKLLIDEFNGLNTAHTGFETFQINPVKSKKDSVIVTDIRKGIKSTGKNLF